MKKRYVELLKIDSKHFFYMVLMLYFSFMLCVFLPVLFYFYFVGQWVYFWPTVKLLGVLGVLLAISIRILIVFYNILLNGWVGFVLKFLQTQFPLTNLRLFCLVLSLFFGILAIGLCIK